MGRPASRSPVERSRTGDTAGDLPSGHGPLVGGAAQPGPIGAHRPAMGCSTWNIPTSRDRMLHRGITRPTSGIAPESRPARGRANDTWLDGTVPVPAAGRASAATRPARVSEVAQIPLSSRHAQPTVARSVGPARDDHRSDPRQSAIPAHACISAGHDRMPPTRRCPGTGRTNGCGEPGVDTAWSTCRSACGPASSAAGPRSTRLSSLPGPSSDSASGPRAGA